MDYYFSLKYLAIIFLLSHVCITAKGCVIKEKSLTAPTEDVTKNGVNSWGKCAALCKAPNCNFWLWDGSEQCVTMKSYGGETDGTGYMYGPRSCQNTIGNCGEATLSKYEFQTKLSEHIQLEFKAMHVYTKLGSIFSESSNYYPGFAKYFNEESYEEKTHAEKVISYLNLRGCSYKPQKIDIALADIDNMKDPYQAVKQSIILEQEVTKSFINLIKSVEDHHFHNFIESELLREQYDTIRKLSNWAKQLKRYYDDNDSTKVTDFHGIYAFDYELLKGDKN